MYSRMFFVAMIVTTAMVVLLVATAAAVAAGARVQFHAPGEFSEADTLDKTWTTGGRENEDGSQVLCYKALASRVSFAAERTGFEPAEDLRPHGFSKPALSTTQPPLRHRAACTWSPAIPIDILSTWQPLARTHVTELISEHLLECRQDRKDKGRGGEKAGLAVSS